MGSLKRGGDKVGKLAIEVKGVARVGRLESEVVE